MPHIFFICQQDADNHLGALQHALERADCPTTIYRSDKRTPVAFGPLRHAGLIIMGGGAYSVDDPRAYIREKGWIYQAMKHRTPVLGICLGAQLLAHVADGRIHRGKTLELGWQRVRVTDAGTSDPVTGHLAPEAEMFQWHYDSIIELPSDAVQLAESVDSPIKHSDVFRLGDRAYGVQFHPEVTREMLEEEWLPSPRGRNQVLARQRMDECFPRIGEIGLRLLGSWIQLAIGKNG